MLSRALLCCSCWKTEMTRTETCLLLGATGVGKTMLLKRLQNILRVSLNWLTSLKSVQLSLHGTGELGAPPPTLPTVGTNLTDLQLKKKKVTVREMGGCMGPLWPSYFKDCSSVIFMVDSANIAQVSSSCIQLLSVLSAEPLHGASVLILFNKRDIPCTMSLIEIKSLFRMDDIIASATQPITTMELCARSGEGLQEVLSWLDSSPVK